MSNQECIIYQKENVSYLKLPKTRLTLPVKYLPESGRLMEVKVTPSYGDFIITCIFEVPDIMEPEMDLPYSCGIDFGVNNIIALVSNRGTCLLYKGGAVKAENRWYNKQLARYRSAAMAGHDSEEAAKLGLLDTEMLRSINRNHHNRTHDMLHKISSDVVRYCLSEQIGLIVMGVNKGWKQESDLGHVNNQNFVQMPIATLRNMIRYKAETVGIPVVEQEESYTSKADLTAGDFMPVYGQEGHEEYQYSGSRIGRGLYRTGSGMVVNADLNAAGNILRKYMPSAFKDRTDWSFLETIKVRRFSDLYKTRISVKGIAAA